MIYLDVGGRGPGLVTPEQALIPASDRGFLYGDGLFETMLVRDGTVPLLPWHLDRLAASAGELGIPCDAHSVEGAVMLAAGSTGQGEHAMRLTLSRGVGARRGYEPPDGADPTLLISTAPYGRPVGPVTAVTASFRIYPGSPACRHKSLSALEKVLARAEAARAGVGEALLINTEGRVAEGAAANLFLCRGSRWLTPALAEGCLPGVMRRRVIALTGASEVRLAPEDLFTSDGVYLTNALMGCLPLTALDGRSLPPAPRPAWAGQLFEPVQ